VDVNSNPNGFSFLVAAARLQNDNGLEIVRFLLDNGANMETTDYRGRTALYVAARYGNPKIARLLIERGANVKAKAKNGQTPLYRALDFGNFKVAELLLANEADRDAQGNDDKTPSTIIVKRRLEKYDETEREEIRHYIAELRQHSEN
jgi:ankyrin repeat protein